MPPSPDRYISVLALRNSGSTLALPFGCNKRTLMSVSEVDGPRARSLCIGAEPHGYDRMFMLIYARQTASQ